MAHEHVEISDAPGCFARLKDSIAKIGIGVVMILIAFPLLFWNEGRAVKRAKDLEVGRGAVESVEADKVSKKHDGKLVHLSGELKATKPAKDSKFKVSADAIGLKRVVEMYQWKENKKTETQGDKKKTTYRYEEVWSESKINSSNFHKNGYSNPDMPVESETFYSSAIKLGAYGVDKKIASKWPLTQEHSLKEADLKSFETIRGSTPTLDRGGAYYGTPKSPQIGDVRITYRIGPAGTATAIAGLEKGTLSTFSSPKMSGTIGMLEEGVQSADAMFQAAEEANVTMTWILRLVGFFLMFVGFNLLFGPIDTIVRMIPLIGGVIDFGTTVLAGILAGAFSFITIAIGWIVYRPLIGILLLVVGMGILAGGVFLGLKAKKKMSAA